MKNHTSDSSAYRAGPLDRAPTGLPCIVRALAPPSSRPGLKEQLEEIGFLPGEPVMVTARGFPGADPLAVRIGQSTFALRAAEAACIHVEAMHE